MERARGRARGAPEQGTEEGDEHRVSARKHGDGDGADYRGGNVLS